MGGVLLPRNCWIGQVDCTSSLHCRHGCSQQAPFLASTKGGPFPFYPMHLIPACRSLWLTATLRWLSSGVSWQLVGWLGSLMSCSCDSSCWTLQSTGEGVGGWVGESS
jgi:hypothetical protein